MPNHNIPRSVNTQHVRFASLYEFYYFNYSGGDQSGYPLALQWNFSLHSQKLRMLSEINYWYADMLEAGTMSVSLEASDSATPIDSLL